jgi:pSer/pThr/pTyr-binding forkhead associated (FHA) protein
VVEGATAVLHDLGSKNGTFLAGRRLEEPAALADGDVITVGTALITVRALRPGGSTETVPGPAAPDSPT